MKKVLCIVFILCISFTFVGCGTEYADTNGEKDFTLQTITDENIINMEIGSSGLVYEEESVGVLHSSEYSSKNFNGVEQIYGTNFLGKSDICIYVGHMNVESGNFRLVVVNDGKIIKDIPLDAFGEEFWFKDLTGSFSVNVVGESAKFDFYIDIY